MRVFTIWWVIKSRYKVWRTWNNKIKKGGGITLVFFYFTSCVQSRPTGERERSRYYIFCSWALAYGYRSSVSDHCSTGTEHNMGTWGTKCSCIPPNSGSVERRDVVTPVSSCRIFVFRFRTVHRLPSQLPVWLKVFICGTNMGGRVGCSTPYTCFVSKEDNGKPPILCSLDVDSHFHSFLYEKFYVQSHQFRWLWPRRETSTCPSYFLLS